MYIKKRGDKRLTRFFKSFLGAAFQRIYAVHSCFQVIDTGSPGKHLSLELPDTRCSLHGYIPPVRIVGEIF